MRHALIAMLLLVLAAKSGVRAGDAVKPIHLDKLNTAADEEDPTPTPDGYSILYVTKLKENTKVHVSTRNSLTTPFPAGRPLKTLAGDKVSDERGALIHRDKTYFSSNEVRDEKFAKFKNFDIFTQIGFQAPFFVGGDINSQADELYPWVTPGGKELYFSRKTENGWKQFIANGPIPGPIGKARDLGFPVGFHHATVAGNGLTMYLQGPLGGGKLGIFRSKRTKVTSDWSKPEPVAGLNHEGSKKGDMQPALTPDGARLYFASDRPGGNGGLDIWMVPTAQLK